MRGRRKRIRIRSPVGGVGRGVDNIMQGMAKRILWQDSHNSTCMAEGVAEEPISGGSLMCVGLMKLGSRGCDHWHGILTQWTQESDLLHEYHEQTPDAYSLEVGCPSALGSP